MKKNWFLFAVLFLMQFTCFADGYWLELEGSGRKGDTLTIRIRYGGVDEQKNRYINNGSALDKMKGYQLLVIDPGGKKQQVPLQQVHDYWVGYYVTAVNGSYQVFAINDQLPVVEREDSLQNIKPVQYLCSVYNIGKATKIKRPVSHLYIEVNVKNDTALIAPLIDGKQVAANTPVRIFYPNNEDQKYNTTKQGTAVLPLRSKGTYLVRLDQLNRKTGSFKGKKYYSVRHRCDYTLTIE